MSFKVKKVAVLATGVMGSQIAAHISNADIEVLAFDMDQETAEKGLKAAQEIKPAAFYNKKNSDLITPLNYNNHLSKEAVLTSNTSGISLSELSEDMNDDLKSRFFITHFFNPPRYT